MNSYNYNGFIKVKYPELSKWCKENFKGIFEKSKAEFIFKEINKEVYIYDDFNNGFLFSAEFRGTFDEAGKFIEGIVESLKKDGITFYQFEWNEVDNEGNQIGDEYEINS